MSLISNSVDTATFSEGLLKLARYKGSLFRLTIALQLFRGKRIVVTSLPFTNAVYFLVNDLRALVPDKF